MSASMSHKIQAQSSSLIRMQEETKLVLQKQGIVSILGSDQSEKTRNTTPNSLRLRRTLSADMSSKKWLSQNGFTPMKRISSSEDLKTTPQSDNIWRDKNKDQQQQQGCFDIWNSILSNKSSSLIQPPYVHPLVKRSQSSLSDKSLQICTESLGSETGSDVFSSYTQSETEGDEHEEQEQKVRVEENEAEKEEEIQVTKYNTTPKKSSSSARSSSSFPPPLPSLSRQNGPSLQMRSRRDDGRLVLEAVSLPSQNNFCAQRRDGRLVLTFANQEEDSEETEDGNEAEETEKKQGKIVTSGITSLALMMNSNNRNPNWSEKMNQVVKNPRVARLISPGPAMASTATFNVYEYYWKTNSTGGNTGKGSSSSSSLTFKQSYNSNNGSSKVIVSGGMNPQVVVLRNKNGDYLVHNLKSCKESRRSFLFWEPYCIATS